MERTVRQFSIAEIEKLVNGTRVDHLPIRNDTPYLPVVRIEHDLDMRMVQHPLEHPCITMEGHRLVGVSKIAVIAVRADWHARDDRCIEFRGVEVPLLARVAPKKFAIELLPHPIHNHILTR